MIIYHLKLNYLKCLYMVCSILFLSNITIAADSTTKQKTLPSEDLIRRLYHDYAWEAVMTEGGGVPLVDQKKEVLSEYFNKSLVDLFWKDGECKRLNHEICSLDFDPIFASQDSAAYDLSISSLKNDVVVVKFKVPSTNNITTIKYFFSKDGSKLLISDIQYDDGSSLKSVLTSKR